MYIEELIEIMNHKVEEEIDEDGNYFEDDIMFNSIKPIIINGDCYEVEFYDETDLVLCEECWTKCLQIFKVYRNDEYIGYLGRECKVSCCGDSKEGKFEEYKAKTIEVTIWEKID